MWYNGRKENKDLYIGNKKSILIGMPWIRQLRVKKSKISVFSKSCQLFSETAKTGARVN